MLNILNYLGSDWEIFLNDSSEGLILLASWRGSQIVNQLVFSFAQIVDSFGESFDVLDDPLVGLFQFL